jgi:hypothetical protein
VLFPDQFVVDLPVETRKGLLVTRGPLGSMGEPVAMKVNTGAFESKLTAATASRVGVEPVLHRNNSDTFGRSRRMPVGLVPELRFGELASRQLGAGLLDWPRSTITPGLAPDRLLGANALRRLSWSMDFTALRFTLSSHGSGLGVSKEADPVAVKIPALSATPRLTVAVNGLDVDGIRKWLDGQDGMVLLGGDRGERIELARR